MSVYLDASVLIALFVPDALNKRAGDRILAQSSALVVSDYAVLEFSSAIMRMTRAKMLNLKDAREALAEFDAWTRATCERAETNSADVVEAGALVRRENIALRSSDAVNVAIARRLGAALLTFDKRLASNARRLGLAIA